MKLEKPTCLLDMQNLQKPFYVSGETIAQIFKDMPLIDREKLAGQVVEVSSDGLVFRYLDAKESD